MSLKIVKINKNKTLLLTINEITGKVIEVRIETPNSMPSSEIKKLTRDGGITEEEALSRFG